MKQAGQVVVFRFPQTDLEEGKLRPTLLLAILLGAIGQISDERLVRLKQQFSDWISGK
jgi:hypothetical protein